MAYGNDFTSTQSADLAEKAAQREAVSQAMNRVLATGEQLRQQSNVNREFAMRHTQMVQALQQRAFENEMEQQKIADMGRRMDIQQEIGKGYLRLGQEQLDMQKNSGTTAANANQRFFIQQAQNDAANGIYNRSKYAGKIPDEMHDPLTAQSDQASAQKNAYATRLQNWADAKNAFNELTARQGVLKSKGADTPAHWYTGHAGDDDRAEYNANEVKRLELQKIVTDPLAEKQYAPFLSYDVKTGKWQSAVLPSPNGAIQTPSATAAPAAGMPGFSSVFPDGSSTDSSAGAGGFSLGAGDDGPTPLSPDRGSGRPAWIPAQNSPIIQAQRQAAAMALNGGAGANN